MSNVSNLWMPRAYLKSARQKLRELRLRLKSGRPRAVCTELAGVAPAVPSVGFYPAGHFYSPLLDVRGLGPQDQHLPFDGLECWEHIPLREAEQRAFYDDLLERFPPLPFPMDQSAGFRYYATNNWFPLSDAYTLSAIIRSERPRRIVEVGSGFSSAVMLDTLEHSGAAAELTFIEPYPDRLDLLLRDTDRTKSRIIVKPVQEVPLSVFDELESQDVLFIDSSHVAKVGSDVVFLLLRVLPRLQPGVLIHFHDLFYPYSYPAEWIREGRFWNESLFLRAFLLGNSQFRCEAFNAFAGHTFPELFRTRFPAFLSNFGGSLWLRKVR
jgi:predicted O-methyltransferase YrrM